MVSDLSNLVCLVNVNRRTPDRFVITPNKHYRTKCKTHGDIHEGSLFYLLHIFLLRRSQLCLCCPEWLKTHTKTTAITDLSV